MLLILSLNTFNDLLWSVPSKTGNQWQLDFSAGAAEISLHQPIDQDRQVGDPLARLINGCGENLLQFRVGPLLIDLRRFLLQVGLADS